MRPIKRRWLGNGVDYPCASSKVLKGPDHHHPCSTSSVMNHLPSLRPMGPRSVDRSVSPAATAQLPPTACTTEHQKSVSTTQPANCNGVRTSYTRPVPSSTHQKQKATSSHFSIPIPSDLVLATQAHRHPLIGAFALLAIDILSLWCHGPRLTPTFDVRGYRFASVPQHARRIVEGMSGHVSTLSIENLYLSQERYKYIFIPRFTSEKKKKKKC